MQASLFQPTFNNFVPAIDGLSYLPDFIEEGVAENLLRQIDSQTWLNDLKRRVQHYGYRYDYRARAAAADSYLGPLPDFLSPIAQLLKDRGIFAVKPNQIIVNEYLPGQGIAPHIDCVPCFGATVASLSLGSACLMDFSKGGVKKSLLLQPCSLLVLSGAARYEWTHAIAPRQSDKVNGMTWPRGRRISLTFRTMRFEQ